MGAEVELNVPSIKPLLRSRGQAACPTNPATGLGVLAASLTMGVVAMAVSKRPPERRAAQVVEQGLIRLAPAVTATLIRMKNATTAIRRRAERVTNRERVMAPFAETVCVAQTWKHAMRVIFSSAANATPHVPVPV
jgi:hypothetical protein